MPPISNTRSIDQAFRFKIQLASHETCEAKYQSLVNYHWELRLLDPSDTYITAATDSITTC
jgi:hypothetical protein